MSSLPQKLPWDKASTVWSTILTPTIQSPIVNGNLLTNQALINGVTVINHKLGRELQGWIIVGADGIADVYDNQASNPIPNLTLSLTSNAAVTVSLWVF